MTERDPQVDAFVERATRWQGETAALREVLLACGLSEALKWGKPCYSYPPAGPKEGRGQKGNNIAIIQGFKAHCAVMFFKGALLDDPQGQLVLQGENSRSAKRMEFTSVAEVKKRSRSLKSLVKQAIEVEKAGLKVEPKQADALDYPAELLARFRQDAPLKRAFEALTPGRKRGYVLHISAAKQSATRSARVDKWAPKILAGLGMHDR